ncbi:MAG: hypothetical protein RPU39_13740 [Candidatus Sedimenticola sp. (ex Thyasira tokunagai)]
MSTTLDSQEAGNIDSSSAGAGLDGAGGQQTGSDSGPPLDTASAAYWRASEKLASAEDTGAEDTDATGDTDSTSASGEQAPDGESTRTEGEGGDTDTASDATTGAESESTSDSIVAAPEDWPVERREQFTELPEDAQTLVLGMQKDMQAGLTKATQQLAEQRQAHETLFTAIDQHGVNEGVVVDLMSTAASFERDPKATLKALAAEKGLDLWFEKPLPDGELPEFENASEMVRYVQDQVSSSLSKQQKESAEADAENTRKEGAIASLQREISDFAASTPEFEGQRTAVIEQMASAPGLSVSDAYALVTLPALKQKVGELQQVEREFKALQQKVEAEKKASTRGPGATALTDDENKALEGLEPAEAAFHKATRKLAAAQH